MRLRHHLAVTTVVATLAVPALAAVPPQVVNKTISISYTVSGEQKNAEGQEHGFSAQVSYTIYVSSSGHPFVRWRTTAGKFSRSGETHGSDRGGERAAVMLTLIRTARLNDVDPQTWLADVLARINDHAALRLHELLPWNWRKPMPSRAEAA